MPAAAPETSLVGLVLAGKYRIVRELGRGGMGAVYEAEHMLLGKRVAIKLMLEKYADDGEATRRFEREALAASRIGDPHIIDVSDIGHTDDGRAFVVMELLSGMPLSAVIERTGPMPPWRAIQIMRQVLRAVGAAHAKGIIHRDLKPDNIFLVDQGGHHDFVKLLDFGISKVVDPDEQVAFTKLTSTGVVIGTPLYMSPEQAMGQPATAAADIYACGVILYEMLAARPPFEGPTYAVLVTKLLTQPPPPLGELRAGLPAPLIKAVHRALEKEPPDRFASAEAFAAALPERSPSQLELAGTIDSGIGVARAVPPPRAPRRTAIAIGAALVVGAATAAVLIATQVGAEAPAETAEPAPPAGPPSSAVPTGTLEVKTTPAGAKIEIDGADTGSAPIVVTLAAGPHRVRASLAGFTAIETTVEIRKGSLTAAVLPLVAAAPVVDAGTPATVPGVVRAKPGHRREPSTSRPHTGHRPPTPTATHGTDPIGPKRPPATPGTEGKPNPYGD